MHDGTDVNSTFAVENVAERRLKKQSKIKG